MLIQLPVEVWMDILDWLRAHRREVAAKCNKLGDRTFSDICQNWLHNPKYTKNVQLGSLSVRSENVLTDDGLQKIRGILKIRGPNLDGPVRIPFAKVPVPENVSGFKQMDVKYLDWKVLNLLRQMAVFWSNDSTKIIFKELESQQLEVLRTAVGHLMPLFSGIGTICFSSGTSTLFPPILHQFPDQFLAANSLHLYVLASDGDQQNVVRSFVHWLCTRREDGQPRMAVLCTNMRTRFVNSIREQFLAAISPINFFVGIYSSQLPDTVFPEMNVENGTTGEQLLVRRQVEDGNELLMVIGRCPANLDGNGWLQEIYQRSKDNQYKPNMCFNLYPTLFGQMESSGEEAEDGDGNGSIINDDQPGPSKKRRVNLMTG